MGQKEELAELKKAIGLDDKPPTLKEIRASDDPDNRGEPVKDDD